MANAAAVECGHTQGRETPFSYQSLIPVCAGTPMDENGAICLKRLGAIRAVHHHPSGFPPAICGYGTYLRGNDDCGDCLSSNLRVA